MGIVYGPMDQSCMCYGHLSTPNGLMTIPHGQHPASMKTPTRFHRKDMAVTKTTSLS
jgi:hypothetical protein